ncbi:hypothetical protein L7F22_057644 [Adiantum nelumboides]|nr:hypothetical protein [Adiantum nelumboides]
MDSTITKFNGDNFFTWQSKTMYLLMRKGLWNLIVGDSTTVFTAQDNHKALGLIAQSLGDDVISHIAGIMDAREAWNALNREFGTASKSSKTNLLMKFYKLKKKDDETLAAHLNKFKELKQQLLRVQKQIPDDEAIAVLLNNVDKALFDTLVSTLQNIEKTLDEVVSTLLEYDSKHRPKSEEEIQAPRERVFYNRGGFQGGRNYMARGRGRARARGQGQILCHRCGRPGHFAQDCQANLAGEANYMEENPQLEENTSFERLF